MLIYVLTLSSEYELDVESSDTIEHVKERVLEITRIPVIQQRLIFAGRELLDDRTLADYNVQKGSTLKLILKIRGD